MSTTGDNSSKWQLEREQTTSCNTQRRLTLQDLKGCQTLFLHHLSPILECLSNWRIALAKDTPDLDCLSVSISEMLMLYEILKPALSCPLHRLGLKCSYKYMLKFLIFLLSRPEMVFTIHCVIQMLP